MSNPDLPEGVTQSDIDATVGETFDPDLCEHETVICENCEASMESLTAEYETIKAKYNALLYKVSRKFDNETRHETALRYIREAELKSSDGCDKEVK